MNRVRLDVQEKSNDTAFVIIIWWQMPYIFLNKCDKKE